MSAQDQARYVSAPWTDVISDDCTCSWINYSDHSGWYRKSANPQCPVHGGDET